MRVIGPTPNRRQEANTRNQLEKACLEEASRQFFQANVTPLLQQPILNQFGEIGTNQQAFKQALAGTLNPEVHEDPFVTKLLKALQRPPQVIDIPQRSLQEYMEGWKKARETTSSSLSSIHFGHYMVGTFNPDILIFNATMADIPLKTGYSPARWCEGLNVMLEESPGNFKIKKLRIIILFKADFNSNNKWIGRAVMRNTEVLNLLAEEQYRSQKHKAAVLQCLNKGLYDLLRQGKCPAALCSNDTKSCYDRITLLAAALSLCRLGATTLSVQSMLSMIHGMNHHIQTAFGDSSKSAGRTTWKSPITGIGQGNGAGPSIWVAVSSPMFDIMRQDGFYALLTGAISKLQRKISGFAFVDDTDLCITHESDKGKM